jgi:hypothetical protein
MVDTRSMQLDVRSIVLPENPAEWPVVDAETRQLLTPKNGLYTPEQVRLIRQLAARRWFFLKNTGPHGEAWRCGRCKQLHDYFTLHCIERPFNGLSHLLGVMRQRIAEDDVFSAVELGMVEPITRERALAAYERLKGLGYSKVDVFGE